MTYIVIVQPITLLDAKLYDSIVGSLNEVFTGIEFLPSTSVLMPPLTAYDWNRGQYYSPKILEYISNTYRDECRDFIVCLGDVDAYSNGLNFVFGEASPIQRVACVYTRRLKPEFYGNKPDMKLYIIRIIKETIHELGHLLGLRHCHNRKCVMSFSNSIIDVDEKTMYFCNECAEILEKLGITQKRFRLSQL